MSGATLRRMPRPPRKEIRSVRVADVLWQRAQAVADQQGEYLSDVIRRALEAYVREHESEG